MIQVAGVGWLPESMMMTKHRANKRSIRDAMAATGTGYLQTKRDIDPPVEAWDTEDAVVIYNTHDPVAARMAYQAYLRMCGFVSGSNEWDAEFDGLDYYEAMPRLWTLPKAEEEAFDTFREPGEGRVPYMYAWL